MVNSTNGRLYLVGLGPGDHRYTTPAGLEILEGCDTVVGYRGYIEQLGELVQGKELVAMELGQELERAAAAVDLAYTGRIVAVVSSGDAGVYGMAGPVFHVLTERQWDGRVPQVGIVPGVSAMQAAASLLGAPLMQDFCAISLSDLLTPWEAIHRRLEAAAQADFVIAIYNPRSHRRTSQLPEARRILLEHRAGSTPVGLVRDAYRPGQAITITDLQRLEQHYQNIDMFTTVVVGNSTTYIHSGRIITPRGYEEKLTHRQKP